MSVDFQIFVTWSSSVPPRTLPTPCPSMAGECWETPQMLCQLCSAVARTLLCLQHLSRYWCKNSTVRTAMGKWAPSYPDPTCNFFKQRDHPPQRSIALGDGRQKYKRRIRWNFLFSIKVFCSKYHLYILISFSFEKWNSSCLSPKIHLTVRTMYESELWEF